jgi:phosphatidylserine/phosphatidylglycerophosphate/cardiolipin synthase-like enzyme
MPRTAPVRWILAVFVVSVLVALNWPVASLQAAPPSIPLPEVHFSPKGGCTAAIVAEIEKARSTLLIQAYSFTSAPIAGAVVDAFRRGVRVQVLLDKSNRTEKYSAADFLAHANVPTFIDAKHAIAHNKIMILDHTTVITGSFNFTKAAEESNAENILILRSPQLAARYTENFLEHKLHAEPYYGK